MSSGDPKASHGKSLNISPNAANAPRSTSRAPSSRAVGPARQGQGAAKQLSFERGGNAFVPPQCTPPSFNLPSIKQTVGSDAVELSFPTHRRHSASSFKRAAACETRLGSQRMSHWAAFLPVPAHVQAMSSQQSTPSSALTQIHIHVGPSEGLAP